LRDGSSADPSIESRYGITRDDYSRKPAFATYRDLIARYGARRGPTAAAASCRRARMRRRPARVALRTYRVC
jgi:hypothetical protein